MGLEPKTLRFQVWCSTDWASRACCMLSVLMTLLHTCTLNTNVYIVISTRIMKDSVFCLVNVLFCVTYWSIYEYCTNSNETHTSCFPFNMQTRTNIIPDLVFACWKQAHDLGVTVLFVQYKYIPVCNNKQCIYKTNYALLHHSRTYLKVYIGIGRTCM